MLQACPFMSRTLVVPSHNIVKDRWGSHIDTTPTLQLMKVQCLEGECKAWQPPTYHCQMASICPRSDTTGCDVDVCTDAKKAVWTEGFCTLIP